MSLVNEYLKRTQSQAPKVRSEKVIPPAISGRGAIAGGSSSKKTVLRVGTFLIIGVVAVFAVYQAQAYFKAPRKQPVKTASVEPGTRPVKDPAVTREESGAITKTARTVSSSTSSEKPVSDGGGEGEVVMTPADPPTGPAAKAGSEGSAAEGEKPWQGKAAQEKPWQGGPKSTGTTPKTEIKAVKSTPGSSGTGKTTKSVVVAARTEAKTRAASKKAESVAVRPVVTEGETDPLFSTSDRGLSGYSDGYAPSAISISSRGTADYSHSRASKPRRATARPGDPTICFQLGLAAQQAGDYQTAESHYLAGLEGDPNNLNLLTNLSAVYIRQKRFDQATKILKKAHAIQPRNVKVLINLGNVALQEGEASKARKWFEEALREDPHDRTALTNLAYLAQQQGDRKELEGYYEQILRIDPDNVEAILAYASLLEQGRRIGDAIKVYKRSLEMRRIRNDSELNSQIRKRIRLLVQYQ